MISIEALTKQFGPAQDVKPWGDCLIIFESQFNREWKKELFNQGYSCHFDILDGYPAVFVPLKKVSGEALLPLEKS